jgi:hypothetical protein
MSFAVDMLTSAYPKTAIKAKCGGGANISLLNLVENKPSPGVTSALALLEL